MAGPSPVSTNPTPWTVGLGLRRAWSRASCAPRFGVLSLPRCGTVGRSCAYGPARFSPVATTFGRRCPGRGISRCPRTLSALRYRARCPRGRDATRAGQRGGQVRSTSRDGLANQLEFLATTRLPWLWKAAQRQPHVERLVNRTLIDL